MFDALTSVLSWTLLIKPIYKRFLKIYFKAYGSKCRTNHQTGAYNPIYLKPILTYYQ